MVCLSGPRRKARVTGIRIADRSLLSVFVGRRNRRAHCVSGAAGVVAAAAFASGPLPLLAALFAVVTGVGLVMPNAAAVALDGHGENAGTAAALLGSGQFLLGGLMAPTMALFGAVTAVSMAITIAALAAAALATVTLSLRWQAARMPT